MHPECTKMHHCQTKNPKISGEGARTPPPLLKRGIPAPQTFGARRSRSFSFMTQTLCTVIVEHCDLFSAVCHVVMTFFLYLCCFWNTSAILIFLRIYHIFTRCFQCSQLYIPGHCDTVISFLSVYMILTRFCTSTLVSVLSTIKKHLMRNLFNVLCLLFYSRETSFL